MAQRNYRSYEPVFNSSAAVAVQEYEKRKPVDEKNDNIAAALSTIKPCQCSGHRLTHSRQMYPARNAICFKCRKKDITLKFAKVPMLNSQKTR